MTSSAPSVESKSAETRHQHAISSCHLCLKEIQERNSKKGKERKKGAKEESEEGEDKRRRRKEEEKGGGERRKRRQEERKEEEKGGGGDRVTRFRYRMEEWDKKVKKNH